MNLQCFDFLLDVLGCRNTLFDLILVGQASFGGERFVQARLKIGISLWVRILSS